VPTRALNRPKANGKDVFNAQDFLDSAGVARKVTEFKKKEAVFSQGDPAKDVLYIQKGGVRLSVVNESGKEAVWRFWGRAIFLARDASPVGRFESGRRPRLRRPRTGD